MCAASHWPWPNGTNWSCLPCSSNTGTEIWVGSNPHWSDLGFTGRANVRDLWTHTQIANQADGFSATLPPHGARLLRVSP
jgi:alpha-galactosidase